MNLTNLINFGKDNLQETEINGYDLNKFVAKSLSRIIEEFFMQIAPSFIIVVSSRRRRYLNFFLIVLQYIFDMVDDLYIQLVFIDHKNPRRIEGPRFYNLLFVDSVEAFLDIDAISYTKTYDTNEYYYIFLMQYDRYMDENMRGIFSYCWNNQLINCNIQFQNAQGELHMYTYFPYSRGKCGDAMPQHINQFVGDNWLRRPYFWSKIHNFYGCPLLGLIRHIPPYSSLSNAVQKIYTGFEVDLVNEVALTLNFTLILREAEEDDRYFPAAKGALSMLTNRTAHFAFGYYRKRTIVTDLYTTTAPHYQSSITAVVCVKAYVFNTFEVLSYPFRLYTWSAIIASSILVLIITRFARSCHPKSIRTFSMLTCAFGIPIKDKPKRWLSFLLFTPWLWSTFLLRSIYSGVLYHLFSNDIYQPFPGSLEAFTNNSYSSVMNHFTFNEVIDIPFYKSNHKTAKPLILNSSNEVIALEYLEKHTHENVFGVIAQEFLMHYMLMNGKSGLFYAIPEILMQQQLCIYFTKHTYLVHQFDKTIMDLKAMGMFKFWKKRYFDSTLLSKSNVAQDKMIKQEDLAGLYMICAALHLVALIIFVFELLSVKVNKLRIIFE